MTIVIAHQAGCRSAQMDHGSVNGTCDSCHVSDKSVSHINSVDTCD